MRPTIYLAQSGLGKTYFCLHNAGWLDLDPHPLQICGLTSNEIKRCFLSLVDTNIYWGYKILVNANNFTINTLLETNRYNLVIFYASPEMKEELHERIKCRALERHNPNDQFIKLFPDFFEVNQKSLAELDHPRITKIQLKPGEYISDYLNKIV